MADYTSDVTKSTQEKSPAEYDDFSNLLNKTMQSAQKQYMGKYETPATAAPVSLADSLKNQGQYASGEFARREAAATGKAGLARTIDTRQGTMSDRVRAALYGRSQARQESQDKMTQAGRSADMKTEQQMQAFGTAMGKMNFYTYKSSADRIDALRDAYRKGTADFQMVDAARNNMLTMSDIDKYFTMLTNDLNNQLNEIQQMSQLEREDMVRQYESASRNSGSIISGLFDILGSSMKK